MAQDQGQVCSGWLRVRVRAALIGGSGLGLLSVA